MRMDKITPPRQLPLLLGEVKDHLRIDHGVEDAYLLGLMQASVSAVELYTGLSLIDRVVDLWLDHWPTARASRWWDGLQEGAIGALSPAAPFIDLPLSPVSAIVEIGVWTKSNTGADTGADTETIIADRFYRLQPGLEPRLFRLEQANWPQAGRFIDSLRIRMQAGFGADWNAVPAHIRQALLLHIAHLYGHRGDEPASALKNSGAKALLAPHRKIRL